MPEKSARPAASLVTGALSIGGDPPDRATAAVYFYEVAVVQPAADARDARDHRQAQLAGDDGGVRQRSTALDEQAGRRREQRNPARVGALGDEDVRGLDAGDARIADYPHASRDDSGRATLTLPLVAPRFDSVLAAIGNGKGN